MSAITSIWAIQARGNFAFSFASCTNTPSSCTGDTGRQFFLDVPSGPFYGFNRPGAEASQGIIQNWWRQGMMGSALAHYEGTKAFFETNQTDDLKAISVPTLVMQGDDDQIVPYKDTSLLQAKLLKQATLKIYPGMPHGMMTTNADVINADLLGLGGADYGGPAVCGLPA
jgi:pimeloyl-ACP methyl ester carboxylesterase